MSAAKTDAIVIRQADFSESSRVVTLFTRDFGKIACLAKGARRLKSAFESSLDLLSECRVLFLKKSSGSLDLLTEAQLIRRFHPHPSSLAHLYSGYYVAELLNALSEEHDPHPELYDIAISTLQQLSQPVSPFVAVTRFELATLREIGQLPNFDTCTICHSEIADGQRTRFWVSQSGLICSRCGDSDYQTTEIHPQSLSGLRQLAQPADVSESDIEISVSSQREIRKLATSAVSHALGRRPKTLPMIQF